MKKIFVVGGMGAGKSTAARVLAEQGLKSIDLDLVGHDILKWDTVKEDLVETFGPDIIGEDGEVIRRALAAKAFVSPAETRKLNRITMPRIEEAYTDLLSTYEAEGAEAVVVECSVFKNRDMSLAYSADVCWLCWLLWISVLSVRWLLALMKPTCVIALPVKLLTRIVWKCRMWCSTMTALPMSFVTRCSPGGILTRLRTRFDA